MKKYTIVHGYELYYKYGLNLRAWNVYNNSDYIICLDNKNVWYLFITQVSDNNLIFDTTDIKDIVNYLMEEYYN